MEITPFFKKDHTAELAQWLLSRGESQELCDSLPAIGFMAKEGPQYIACMFLRMCEGGVGIIDSYATNPEIISTKRHEAIEKLLDEVIASTRIFKIKRLIAFSIDKGTIERGVKRGFKVQKHTLFALKT